MARHLKESYSEIILNLLHLSQKVNTVYTHTHTIAIQPREIKMHVLDQKDIIQTVHKREQQLQQPPLSDFTFLFWQLYVGMETREVTQLQLELKP